MNRRILTAMLSLAFAACGGMELDDVEYFELGTGEQALRVALVPIGSELDPRLPDERRKQDEVKTQVAVISEGPGDPLLIVTAAAPAYPGASASSTQDPIPARIRRELHQDTQQDPETGSPGRPR